MLLLSSQKEEKKKEEWKTHLSRSSRIFVIFIKRAAAVYSKNFESLDISATF